MREVNVARPETHSTIRSASRWFNFISSPSEWHWRCCCFVRKEQSFFVSHSFPAERVNFFVLEKVRRRLRSSDKFNKIGKIFEDHKITNRHCFFLNFKSFRIVLGWVRVNVGTSVIMQCVCGFRAVSCTTCVIFITSEDHPRLCVCLYMLCVASICSTWNLGVELTTVKYCGIYKTLNNDPLGH